MPMEAEDLAEMESMIAAARKKELNFAVCMGKKPEGTIFFLHRLKDGEVLARKAKKAGDTAKIAYGLAAVKGKKLNLKCAEDPPPNMARSMKMFLKDSGFPFKVYLLNMAGDVIDSDGEDDGEDDDAKAASAAAPGQEQDGEGRAATPGEEPEGDRRAENEGDAAAAPDPLAERWGARVGPLADLFAEAMTKNPPNRTQLEAAWAMAGEKADALDFKAALVIADKIEPSLKGLLDQKAGAEADPLKAKYDAALGRMEALRARALAAEPPNVAQLEAAWMAMTGKAEAGDYKTALAAAAKLLPALEAAAVTDPNAAPWIRMEGELSPLYLEAMKQNPPDATKLQAAWAMATEKAEAKDYAGAVRIGERLKPLLEAAANPAAAAPPPPDPRLVKLREAVEKIAAQVEALPEAAEAPLSADLRTARALLDTGEAEAALAGLREVQAGLKTALDAQARWMKAMQALEPSVTPELSVRRAAGDSNLQTKWDFAIGLGADGAFERAIAALGPVAEALKTPPAAAQADVDAKDAGVVAFQRSRILWLGARNKMLEEAQALADAVTAQGADDEDADEIAAAGEEILAEVKRVDERLQDVLDQITTAEPGRTRDTLKLRAAGIVSEYQAMLSSGIFATIDKNPIRPVAVAGPARAALGVIARTLA